MKNIRKRLLIQKFNGNEEEANKMYGEILCLKNVIDTLQPLISANLSKDDARIVYRALLEAYSIVNTEIGMPIVAKFPNVAAGNGGRPHNN